MFTEDEYEESLQKLRDFNLEPVTKQMKKRHDIDDAEELENKFRRFMKALLNTKANGENKPLSPHPEIDEYWHEFILDTPRYHVFCEEIFGSYQHHVPGSPEDADYDDIDGYINSMDIWK